MRKWGKLVDWNLKYVDWKYVDWNHKSFRYVVVRECQSQFFRLKHFFFIFNEKVF